MANEEAGERTEEATQQRREEFKKRGQVAQSKELVTFLLLMSTALTFWGFSSFYLRETFELFTQFFSNYIFTAARDEDYRPAVVFALQKGVFLAAPVLAVTFVVSFLASPLQIGFIYNEEALQFKLEKINPISGFQRIFSLRSLVDGIKSVIKITIIGLIVYTVIQNEMSTISAISEKTISEIFAYFGWISLKLLASVTLFMAILGILDFAYQKWEMEKEMRMSKQEIKEENKNREGDPLVKARIRRVQREMANKRMMSDVPKADVIITNPTHIAVALKYEAGMASPVLLAKGADLVAEKIRNIAKEHRIPIVENKPLARAIYKTLKIGQYIPRELFKAVAEVLAYVYRLKKKRAH